MPRQRTFLKGLIFCALVGLSGCAIDWPAYQSPKLDLPPPPAAKPASVDRQWWKAFADPALDGLVVDALANNLDLAKAAANVAEARALVGEAKSLLSPRIDVGGRLSVTQRQMTIGSKDINDVTTSGAAGATLNWEWDLWGRIKQTNDAALARLASSEHTRNAVDLSVSYAVAEAYFQLLALEAQLRVLRESVRNLEELTNLEYRRWQAQVGTELAYRQSMAELAGTLANIPPLQVAVARTELALQILVGRSPRQMSEPLARAEKLPTLPATPQDFDAQLLLRRPDIASAEQLLVAAHADINAIQAERYPRLTLSILAGLLLTTSSAISGVPLYWDITGGLVAPLYDGGLIDSRVEGAQARRDKAEAHYRYTVSVAFRETYDAMVQRDWSDKELRAKEYEVEMRRKSVALTEKSYEAGRSSKFEVLTEMVKLYNTQLQVVGARRDQYVSRALLYKALGGGF